MKKIEPWIKFKKSTSWRNKSILIIYDEYIFNFKNQNKKSKIDKLKCKDLKKKYKFSAYIKLKEDKIVDANNFHNYPNHQIDIIKEEPKKT